MKQLLSIDVQMSWGQAFSYAAKSGYAIYILMAIAILALAAFILFKGKSDFKIIAVGFCLMLAGAAIVYKPGTIKFNNHFKMEQSSYDYYKNQSTQLVTFWDSLYNNTRLIGASNK